MYIYIVHVVYPRSQLKHKRLLNILSGLYLLLFWYLYEVRQVDYTVLFLYFTIYRYY